MKHLLSPLDLSVPEIDQLIAVAEDIEKDPKKYSHVCDGKKLATCFYEPSTRTRLSFEAAMLNLGGAYSVFPAPIPVPPPRAKAYPTRPASSDAMPTSSPCVIPRRARPW